MLSLAKAKKEQEFTKVLTIPLKTEEKEPKPTMTIIIDAKARELDLDWQRKQNRMVFNANALDNGNTEQNAEFRITLRYDYAVYMIPLIESWTGFEEACISENIKAYFELYPHTLARWYANEVTEALTTTKTFLEEREERLEKNS